MNESHGYGLKRTARQGDSHAKLCSWQPESFAPAPETPETRALKREVAVSLLFRYGCSEDARCPVRAEFGKHVPSIAKCSQTELITLLLGVCVDYCHKAAALARTRPTRALFLSKWACYIVSVAHIQRRHTTAVLAMYRNRKD